MVIDTSAVMAILQQEPDARRYADMIDGATERLISAVSVLKAGILARSRKGDQGAQEFDAFRLPRSCGSSLSTGNRRLWPAKPSTNSARGAISRRRISNPAFSPDEPAPAIGASYVIRRSSASGRSAKRSIVRSGPRLAAPAGS